MWSSSSNLIQSCLCHWLSLSFSFSLSICICPSLCLSGLSINVGLILVFATLGHVHVDSVVCHYIVLLTLLCSFLSLFYTPQHCQWMFPLSQETAHQSRPNPNPPHALRSCLAYILKRIDIWQTILSVSFYFFISLSFPDLSGTLQNMLVKKFCKINRNRDTKQRWKHHKTTTLQKKMWYRC